MKNGMNFGGFDVRFNYSYIKTGYINPKSDTPEYKPKAITVIISKDGRELSRGVARCSSLDLFNKEKGRKLALSRAVMCFFKEDRKAIWNGYFARKSD